MSRIGNPSVFKTCVQVSTLGELRNAEALFANSCGSDDAHRAAELIQAMESSIKPTLEVVDSNILTIATACRSTNLQPLEMRCRLRFSNFLNDDE